MMVQIMGVDVVTVVSGLPRSGTSLMMSMLEAGGMRVLTDELREPDEDNPEGYYEFERVKQIEHDQAWLEDAKGKVVKIVSERLRHLPEGYAYKVIFMRRKMQEVLDSQRQMLMRRGEPAPRVSDEEMAEFFKHHLREIEAWLARQPHIEVIYVWYNEVLENPIAPAERINQFLGNTLDVQKMVNVIDPTLYRQRR